MIDDADMKRNAEEASAKITKLLKSRAPPGPDF